MTSLPVLVSCSHLLDIMYNKFNKQFTKYCKCDDGTTVLITVWNELWI